MSPLLRFDTMITPKLITMFYWLLLLTTIVAGIAMMFVPMGYSRGPSVLGFFAGLVVIVVGTLLVRVACELVIVLFKINDHARQIAGRE